MSELLKAEGLGKTYKKGPQGILVLKDLDLTVQTSDTISVMGASGVGKSTLLHILGALDRPTEGKIQFMGQDFSKQPGWALARFRNQSIGFVFQFHYLLPEFTAVENVAMPLFMKGLDRPKAFEQARQWLDKVGLMSRLSHRPAELSGGEQQRVAIARALVGDPSILLADEPTGDLDIDTGKAVTDLLFEVVATQKKSLIVATHNPEVAMRAHRVYRLKEGRLHLEKESR